MLGIGGKPVSSHFTTIEETGGKPHGKNNMDFRKKIIPEIMRKYKNKQLSKHTKNRFYKNG